MCGFAFSIADVVPINDGSSDAEADMFSDSEDEDVDNGVIAEEQAEALNKLGKVVEEAKNKAGVSETNDSAGETERGVIYIGHLPFGFFEDQMKAFFSQFGEVTRLRISRNPKVGLYFRLVCLVCISFCLCSNSLIDVEISALWLC